MFHVIKHGVGREAAASIVLLLCYLCYFDFPEETKNLPDRLARCFKTFKLWCETNKKTPSMKNFTRANLHFDKQTSFPYMGGKGSDVTLVLMFLEFYLRLCLNDMKGDRSDLLTAMLQQVQGTLNFLGVMHSHDLWIPQSCATFMMTQGLLALRAYSFCASECIRLNRRLFAMRPKFHLWAHTVFEMKEILARVPPEIPILNCCIYNCEQNEDFIGRISRVSRHVSTRLTIYRTIQRYGVGFQARLRRMGRRGTQRWKVSFLDLLYICLKISSKSHWCHSPLLPRVCCWEPGRCDLWWALSLDQKGGKTRKYVFHLWIRFCMKEYLFAFKFSPGLKFYTLGISR